MVLSLNHGFIFEPWFYIRTMVLSLNHGFIFEPWFYLLNHGFISLQALRKDAYDHFTAIYYLLLDRLKMDQSRALTGDQVMIMPVCVSLVISLVTNPACCHGHQVLTEQRQSGSVGGVNFFLFLGKKFAVHQFFRGGGEEVQSLHQLGENVWIFCSK